MHGRYIDVVVEEQEELPEGCELRFHAVGESRPVSRVRYEPLTGGPEADYVVVAAGGATAMAAPVDDSGAGTSILIYGDARGLRLRPVDGPVDAAPIAEPYLLLADDAVLD